MAVSVLSSSSSRARTTGRILASGGAAEVGGIRNGIGLGGARKGHKRIVREVQRGLGLPEEWRRMADADWEGAAQARKERRVGYGEGTRENLGRLQAVGTTAVAFRDGEPCNFQRRRPATPNPPPVVPPAGRGQGQTRRVRHLRPTPQALLLRDAPHLRTRHASSVNVQPAGREP